MLNPAIITPGAALTASASCRRYGRGGRIGSLAASPPARRRKTRADDRNRIPSVLCRAHAIAMPARRRRRAGDAVAISATTSACDTRLARAPTDTRTPASSASAGEVCLVCHSGASVDATAVSSPSASATRGTVASISNRRARHELGAKERHRADQRHAHEDAERGAGDRHQRALEKELPPEPGRRGAKRDARGYFSRTRHRSHEQEAGDVRARDDEEQEGAASNSSSVGRDRHADAADPRASTYAWCRMGSRPAMSARCSSPPRRASSITPGFAARRQRTARVRIDPAARRIERDPHRSRRPRCLEPRWNYEPRRHDRRNGVGDPIEHHRRADDVRIGTKRAPQGVRNRGAAVVREPVAHRRRDAERRHQIGRDRHDGHVPRIARRRQAFRAEREDAEDAQSSPTGVETRPSREGCGTQTAWARSCDRCRSSPSGCRSRTAADARARS